MKRARFRQMTAGVLVTLLGWVLLAIATVQWDPRWPARFEDWHTLGVVILAVEFLALKSWMMARRARSIDRLTAALVAANVAFGVVYLWVFLLLKLWPSLYTSRAERWVTARLLDGLALVLLWGLVEIWRVPEPPDEES